MASRVLIRYVNSDASCSYKDVINSIVESLLLDNVWDSVYSFESNLNFLHTNILNNRTADKLGLFSQAF